MALTAISTLGAFLAQKGIKLLGNILTGATKAGAEVITKKIKERTGLDINILSENQITTEQIEKLRRFEFENRAMLIEHVEKLYSIDAKDRANARSLQQQALNQNDLFSKRFIYFYAAFVTLATFLYIFSVTWFDFPDDNARTVDTVLGFLLGVSLSAIIQFFFGSSKSSKDKEEKINELYKKIK